MSIANTSVAENDGNAEFTVSLTNAAASDVVLAVAYADGTASLTDDLGTLQTTVTINQGQTSATLLVPIIDDKEEEEEETFTVTITGSNLPPEAILGSSTTATGTIEDDDDGAPAATVSIGNASVAENDGNAEFTVSLTQAVESDVTVAVAYTDGTATLATDLGTRLDTVTIDEGNTEATLLVPIFNDEIVEGDEDFTVTISEGSTPLPEGVTIGTAATGTGTITDNDLAEITLGPATLEMAENETFTYTVSLSKAADEAVTVRWTATDGTASVDDDLQEQTNTVTFDANDNTAQEFTISPVDDPDDEVNETFTVTLEVDTAGTNPLPTGVTIGTSNTSTATITDNDDPTGPDLTVDGVTVSSASVVEGASFTINATVNNGGNAASAATTLTYYRSADATITTGDTSIGTDAVGALAASGSSTQNISVSIATADTYYVGACVPTVSGETDTDNNCSTGVQVTVTAAVAPAITTQPTDQSVTVGGSATFTVTATGTPTPTYQWRFEGTNIDGATSETYTLSNAALTNAGDYTVVVTNTAGTVTSTAATLTVTPAAVAPQITTQPTNQSVTVGETATFTVTATGTPTPTYQWHFDGTEISGATSASYTISSAALTNAGDYTVVVTNTAGTVTSTAATLTVTPAAVAPQITTQPTDQSVTVGENATFTVAATGTPAPTYQWHFDGTEISGATSASYAISSAALTNAGDYTVVVTNTAGTVTSTAATLTVTAATVAPQITTQPTDQSVTVGGSATFTVTATGTPTPTYQWRFEGSDIDGATSASYTLSNAALINAGDYTVVVTNTAGEVTSSAATLTVTAATVAPQITTQPTDQSVTVGGSATFTVTATGTPTPTYQWRFEGSDIDGATSASYAISSAALTNAGDYTVVVTNTAGTVTSTAATLTVTPAAVAPQITTQPTDQSVTVGENATFTVTATGTPTPTYQWRFAGSDISGATSASYTLSSAALTNAGEYTVVVTNTAGTVTSTAATLTVTAAAVAPQITTQPTNQSVTVGGSATFTVTATGTPTPTYQWRFEGSDIAGATLATYTLSNAALTNAGDYTVVVTNTAGEVTSTAATLTVTPATVAPQITTQPTDQSVTVGGSATFTVTATGTPTPTYQWRFEGTEIAGATSASYTLSNAALTNAGDYTVVVTNTAGTVTSSAATLTVTAATVAPQITTQPTNQSVTVGENATFTVAATGTPTPTYQWRFEGSDIAGATLATYTLSNAALTNAGDYTVVVTNTAGTVTSSAATLTVTAATVAPQITTQPTNQSVTVGGSATFTVTATGTPTPTYQWRFEGSDIAGATSASYTLSNAALTNAGDYTVVVTNTAGAVTSSAATLTVTAATVAPQITTQPVNQSVTVGGSATFTVAATGTPTPTYQWRFEGSDISGATLATYTLSNAALTNAGDYTVVVTNTAGTVTSTAATLTVTAAATPDARVSIANASVAENASAGTIGFTVSLDRAVDNAVTLAVAYTAGTATLATDLGTRPTTVTIDQGQTEATLAVPVTNDAIVERNETFTVTLSEGTTALPDDVTIGTGVATGTITDADTATVALSSTAPPPASEGGTITFTVELDNPVAEGFSLGWAASNGTATVDDDLDDQSGTVAIDANARTATFTIPITNDDDLESSETFTVALTGAPTGLVNIAPSRVTVDRTSATGTINASDTGDGNTVNIGNRTVAENVAGGSIGFTVSLDRAVGSAVTLAVAYTAGTATLADDLRTPRPTTVTINANTTSATLLVPIANETLVEGSETFTVTLSAGTTPLPAGVIIGNGTATGTITNDDEAEIRTNVAEVNEAAASLRFRPGVTAPLAQDLVLSWSVTGGTASAADFSQYVSSGTVTIPARQNSGSILFFPRDDDVVEGSETLTLTFAPVPGTTLPDGVTFGSTTATGTIRDNDEVDINLRVVADVSETDARLTFRSELTARLTQDVTLAWEVTGGTASAEDFSEYVGSGTVTVEAGRGGAPIRFMPLEDDAVEGPETLEVTISVVSGTSLPRGVNLGTTTATATIVDSGEVPTMVDLSIDDASAAEGANIRFPITLSAALTEEQTLNVTYTAGSASLDDLGSDRPTTLTLPTGTTTVNLEVPTVDDDSVEESEAFSVTLSSVPGDEAEGAPLANTLFLSDPVATGTITDNDEAPAPTVDLNIDDASAAEGANIRFPITLSAALTEEQTLNVTYTAGSASLDDLGSDRPTTLTLPTGTTTVTLEVPTVDDDSVEESEAFSVTLSSVPGDEAEGAPLANTLILSDPVATGTITDNDEAPAAPTVDLSIDDASAAEGDDILFPITLSAALTEEQTLNVTYTAGSASLDDLGSDRPTTLTLPTGTTTVNLEVPTVDDDSVEESEAFTVTLSSVPGDEAEGAPLANTLFLSDPVATGTITDDDDDAPASPTVDLSIDDASAAEGATILFPITLSAALTEARTLNVTYTAGSASLDDLGSDRPTTLTLPTGTTTLNLAVPTVDDDSVEESEAFTVTLSPVPGDEAEGAPLANTLFLSDPVATGTITDDDEAPPPEDDATVSLSPLALSRTEGEPFTFQVALSRASASPVTVRWRATSGTARVSGDDSDLGPGQDVTGTVVFAAGTDETQTFSIATLDDLLVEGTETFTVKLNGRLPVGVSYGTRRATATLVDDDRATVSISPPTPSEDEGGIFNFAVNLSAPVHEAVTVRWRAVSGTARVSGDDSDLEAGQDVTGTVFFAAGTDEAQTFSLATLDDLLVEGDETFTVKLSGRLPMRVNYGTRTATATIADDDRATVVLAPPTPSEDEGGVFNFTASLSQAVAEEVSVTWTATSGTARVSGDDSDLEASQDVTGTVVFAAGTAEDQTFSLATLNDTRVEGDEDFTVTLNGDLSSGVDYGTRTAIATIVDDDLATVDIEDASPVAEDAGPARFRVTLNRELDQDAVLDVAYVAGSAALADLGSPRPATVTIAAGGTEASLDVPIFDDELVEGEETFTVILTGDSLPNGVSVADGVALGTIARTSEQSALIESRRSGAGAALRRHVNRFDRMTSTLVRNRLDGRKTQNLSGSKNLGDDNPLSVGGGLSRGLGGTHWGTWIDGAWAGLGGTASGQQADLYGGMDYRSGNGRWLIGALAGYELADLDTGEADYRADFTQIGFYGGARLSERLLFDGAATYGMASPEIALGDVSASYDARRFTARAALTGNFGLEFGLENGSVRIEPQLGALYARETLGAFTDSVGGVAGREVLELGRFNAGPRLTWEFEGGQMVGGIRLQSDVLKLQDGVDGRFSGAADIGLQLDLGPDFRMGFQLDLDGIGNEDDFGSLGGRIELGIGFGSGPRTTQVRTRNERGGPTRESSRPAVSKPNFTHH